MIESIAPATHVHHHVHLAADEVVFVYDLLEAVFVGIHDISKAVHELVAKVLQQRIYITQYIIGIKGALVVASQGSGIGICGITYTVAQVTLAL